jgi:2-oxoglutarate ferredoxin oxidoreductase subunit beta
MIKATNVAVKVVEGRPKGLTENPVPYCPGCGHSVVQRLIAETIEAMGVRDETVAVIGAGCYTNGGMGCFDFPRLSALHGRAPAVATGVKRSRPDAFVFTLQGDGDLAAIGIAEFIHVCMRGERIAVVMLNNSTYGNTGGQMSPTTQLGQKTLTSPEGRAEANHGAPIQIAEWIATLPGVRYSARGAVNTAQNLVRTRRSLRRAFDVARAGTGLGFVEVLSQCPTFWGVDPVASLEWVKRSTKTFPLGEFKADRA